MTTRRGAPLRFAICGTGRMAETMAGEIRALADEGVSLQAVASRSDSRAAAFAARHLIPTVHSSIEALAADREVDAVYLATPPALHFRQLEVLVGAGKAVLCEKPFTLNARQARAIAAAARRRNVLVMEAMWTSFLPGMQEAVSLLASGAIGAPQLLVAGGAFVPQTTDGYLHDRRLGGGVLLDAGVYLVTIAAATLGPVRRALASAEIGPCGVDDHDAVILEHASGARSLLYVSMRARRIPDAEWIGSEGSLELVGPVYRPTRCILRRAGRPEETLERPCAGTGYRYQLEDFVSCWRSGLPQSRVVPLESTVMVLETMDSIRAAIGMRYEAD